MKNNKLKKIVACALATVSILGMLAGAASAAPVAEATIDTSRTGSIDLYKFDFTNAVKDGVWNADSYESTGVYDQNVIDTLGTDNGKNYAGNGYAIEGVEFSYLKVAEIGQLSEKVTANGTSTEEVHVLYGFPADEFDNGEHEMLTAIDLTADDRFVSADDKMDATKADCYWFDSDVLVSAMRDALATDATAVKNALETYISGNGGTAMDLTDVDGYTSVDGLPLGLYLMVETKVPENVTNTTNPFLVSVPMTSINGTNATDGGNRWIYDITLFPKNETGIPTLEKTVREAKEDTGKNNGSTAINDGYAHNATASEGDVVEYQIVSTLPSITSNATALKTYSFMDTLSKGLEYNKNDIKVEFFTDAACTGTPVATWNEADGKFTVAYGTADNDATTMTIAMTAAGLNEINTGDYAGSIAQGETVRRGYSDLTMRITYAATVNSNADTVLGDAGNPNNVLLTWARTTQNYYDVLEDDAHVYTYGMDLTKLFADKNGAFVDDDYSAVKFVVYNKTDKYWVKASLDADTGIYYVTDHTNEADETADTYETIFSPMADGANKGKIVIRGLEDDEYIVTEIETANGYTLLKENIDVLISVSETADDCSIYDDQDVSVLVHNLIQNDPRFAEADPAHLTDLVLGWMRNVPQKQLAHKLLTATAIVDGNEIGMASIENGEINYTAQLKVINKIGFDLPRTGSTGTWMLSIIGILGMGAAAFILLKAFKKKESENV